MVHRRNGAFSQVDGIAPVQSIASERGLSGPLLSWPVDKPDTHPRCHDCGQKIEIGAKYRVREDFSRPTATPTQGTYVVSCVDRFECRERVLESTVSASVRDRTDVKQESLGAALEWKIPIV